MPIKYLLVALVVINAIVALICATLGSEENRQHSTTRFIIWMATAAIIVSNN